MHAHFLASFEISWCVTVSVGFGNMMCHFDFDVMRGGAKCCYFLPCTLSLFQRNCVL